MNQNQNKLACYVSSILSYYLPTRCKGANIQNITLGNSIFFPAPVRLPPPSFHLPFCLPPLLPPLTCFLSCPGLTPPPRLSCPPPIPLIFLPPHSLGSSAVDAPIAHSHYLPVFQMHLCGLIHQMYWCLRTRPRAHRPYWTLSLGDYSSIL